jgi:hypothetical protein
MHRIEALTAAITELIEVLKAKPVVVAAAEPKAPVVEAPIPPTATAQEPAPTKPETSAVTYEELRAAFLALYKKSASDAMAILASFGVPKLPELKPEQYAEAMGKING